MAGSSPASSNSDSEGEALVLESPLSGSSSMNSSASQAVFDSPRYLSTRMVLKQHRAGCTTNLYRSLPAEGFLFSLND